MHIACDSKTSASANASSCASLRASPEMQGEAAAAAASAEAIASRAWRRIFKADIRLQPLLVLRTSDARAAMGSRRTRGIESSDKPRLQEHNDVKLRPFPSKQQRLLERMARRGGGRGERREARGAAVLAKWCKVRFKRVRFLVEKIRPQSALNVTVCHGLEFLLLHILMFLMDDRLINLLIHGKLARASAAATVCGWGCILLQVPRMTDGPSCGNARWRTKRTAIYFLFRTLVMTLP